MPIEMDAVTADLRQAGMGVDVVASDSPRDEQEKHGERSYNRGRNSLICGRLAPQKKETMG